MLLVKKKSKKKTFITADVKDDIKDEEEAIESYSEQVQELDDEGNYAEADKINHILGQEKQHKKILVGIKKSTAVISGGKLLLKVRESNVCNKHIY